MIKPVIIGIIGILGKFGKVLEKYFQARGYNVIGSDIKTDSSNIDVVKNADVVVIAADLFAFADVIREITPFLRPDQLVIEIASVKQVWRDLLLATQASVISIHPMWSHMDDWKNQRLVICPIRPGTWLPFVDEFFSGFGVQLITMTPEKHDSLAAIVQGLVHPLTILMAEVMRRTGVEIKEAGEIETLLFEIRAGQMGRLFAQDPELFAGLLFLNPNTAPVLRTAQAVLAELVDIIARQDLPAFKKLFAENRANLGDFVPEASKRAGKLMAYWKEAKESI